MYKLFSLYASVNKCMWCYFYGNHVDQGLIHEVRACINFDFSLPFLSTFVFLRIRQKSQSDPKFPLISCRKLSGNDEFSMYYLFWCAIYGWTLGELAVFLCK